MISASTGAAFAGVVTVYVTLDAGVQTIGSVGSGLATLEGNGYYTYQPSAAETDAAKADFTFTGPGAVPVTVQYPTITLSQQAAIVGSSVSGAVSVLDICTAAARELNILMTGEPLNANDGAAILGKLNLILDQWNAQRQTAFSVAWHTFTLTPGLSPHTIGPTSTWELPVRPDRIDGASFIYESGSTPAYVP